MIPVLSPVPTGYAFVPRAMAPQFWRYLRDNRVEEVYAKKGFHCVVSALKTNADVQEVEVLLRLHGITSKEFEPDHNDLKVKVWKLEPTAVETVDSIALEIVNSFNSEEATPVLLADKEA